MNLTRLLAVAALLAAGPAARAEFVLSMPDGAAHPGAPLRYGYLIFALRTNTASLPARTSRKASPMRFGARITPS